MMTLKSFKALKPRDQALILGAALVIVIMGYNLGRYQPAQRNIQQVVSETEQAQSRLKTLASPPRPSSDPAQLQSELTQVEQDLDHLLKDRLHPLENRFAQEDASEPLQALKVELSTLATSSGLQVIKFSSYLPTALPTGPSPTQPLPGQQPKPKEASAANAPATGQRPREPAMPAVPTPEAEGGDSLIKRFAKGEPYRRPLHRMDLEGSYTGLRRFVRGLPRLPWQITIAQLKVETGKQPAGAGAPQPLAITMILAL